MKVIIAGSRTIGGGSMDAACRAIDMAIEMSGFKITEVVSGTSGAADMAGERWATKHGIIIMQFVPDWNEYGKAAGPMRNQHMANYADALIAVWDGVSRGTRDMIRRAKKAGLKVKVYKWTPRNPKSGGTRTGRRN